MVISDITPPDLGSSQGKCPQTLYTPGILYSNCRKIKENILKKAPEGKTPNYIDGPQGRIISASEIMHSGKIGEIFKLKGNTKRIVDDVLYFDEADQLAALESNLRTVCQ